ncbi:SH3 domain-containing protein [Mesoflavibacter profundi]|uniref:SH3 domain-containing protein n=1 Tax=Mesoflavibacter profundi TaxID=2708110 RepID=A0ABT4S2X7_9FLAO|nr:SH3 domain-containing protein [Mesoflavibacter profundi]MDA0178421.1 SH3 domain-containing protein [Mesoflavibacter profundi]
MKQKILLILILSVVGIKFGHSQSCYGDYPIYYAKGLVYIYQNMDSESAIKGEIPNGKSVKVVSSSFGKMTGFWEVCYNGTTGYAKKSKLSYKKTYSSTKPKSNPTITKTEVENQDVGFDPFLGQTTSSVNFRSGPSSSNSKIKTLSAGSTVYVYSNKSINNYYKAIDVMTSQIGWIHKNYVKYVQDVDVNEKGAFQSTGYTSSYNSEVSIRNKSSYTIKLVVGEETFTLSPNSTKSVKVKPGRKYYIATAPGVIPASGYQSFHSNNGYEWEFWVQTSRY